MEVKIEIDKKSMAFLYFFIFVLSGALMVYAYNPLFSGGDAKGFGHSADEVNVKISGNIWTVQEAVEDFEGINECNINSSELENKGCPNNAYLFKVNKTGISGCREHYSKIKLTPSLWCYPLDHSSGFDPSSCNGICGVCNNAYVNECCSCSGVQVICDGSSWKTPTGPLNQCN